MLKSENLFGVGKRDTANSAGRETSPSPFSAAAALSKAGSASSFSDNLAPTASHAHDTGSKLIVGPNIKLKGVEITDCDTLVVEGQVEATMNSRVIFIAKNGMFKGSAEVDVAEVHGEFVGDLIAKDKLLIHASGKVCGKIAYGKLVVEEGGQLTGEVGTHAVSSSAAAASPATVPSTKPAMTSVA